jgi:hypothetical protein
VHKTDFHKIPVVVLVCAFILLVGCAPLRKASTINVEFQDSVQGLHKGDQVYLLGLVIGEAENPFALNNRAIVPVVLQDTHVFDQTSQVLFLLVPDQGRPGRQCLVAYLDQLPAEPGQPRFRGFTSRVKLNLQMGSESIGSWWKSLGNTQ